jgi:hypothetical protein
MRSPVNPVNPVNNLCGMHVNKLRKFLRKLSIQIPL